MPIAPRHSANGRLEGQIAHATQIMKSVEDTRATQMPSQVTPDHILKERLTIEKPICKQNALSKPPNEFSIGVSWKGGG